MTRSKRWILIFSHLFHVSLIIPSRQDASEDARMECLDPSAKYRRISGYILYPAGLYACPGNELIRSPGGNDRNTKAVKPFHDSLETVFVKNRNKGALYFYVTHNQ